MTEYNEYPDPATVELSHGCPREIATCKALVREAARVLAWDYVDTVIDCAAVMKHQQGKRIARVLRELQRAWDKHRDTFCGDIEKYLANELRGVFDNAEQTFYSKLFYTTRNEIRRHNFEPNHEALLVAVEEARTMIRGLILYAQHCQEWAAHYRPDRAHDIDEKWHHQLDLLVSLYSGDYRFPAQLRETHARIVANSLRQMAKDFYMSGRL